MLQLWFEQFLDQLAATNQEPLKDDWLAWARGRGLKIGRNEEIQAALRSRIAPPCNACWSAASWIRRSGSRRWCVSAMAAKRWARPWAHW